MTLKIGFIGTGGIAQNHLKNLADIDGADVIAFTDIQLERAEKAAAAWSDARAYTKAADMLDDRKLDAVYICLPPMAHGEAEYLTIERGIPFLVEKPLGIDQALPREIAAAVAAKKLITSVGYHWRYSEAAQQARELLRSQTIGMALGYWLGGMPGVPWWRVQTGSGGQFVEQTTHITDLLRYLCGEVVEVYAAYGQRVMHKKVEGTTVADVGTVTLKLDNGIVATVSNSCMLPAGGRVGLDIYTDEGMLGVTTDGLNQVIKGKSVQLKNQKNAYHTEDEVFLAAVRSGDPSGILCDYAEALKTHEVTTAANDSALSGQPVKLR